LSSYFNRKPVVRSPQDKCPDCGCVIKLEEADNRLMLLNLDSTRHNCGPAVEFEKHPIGQTVMGKTIKDFQLRGRRLTISLGDGSVLSVTAAGTPLTLQLKGPSGIMQE